MDNQIDSQLKKRIDLVWIGVILGLVYWTWQSYRDVILQKSTFIQSFLFPDLMSLATRILVVSVFLMFCIHGKYIQENILEDKSARGKTTGFWVFLISAIGFIVLYWIIESFQDVVNEAKGEAIKKVFPSDRTVFITRSISILFIIILFFLSFYLFQSRKKAEKIIKNAYDQLTRSRENLNKIVSNDVDALFVINEQKNMVFVNRSGEKMFRAEAAQLLGKPLNYPIRTDLTEEFDIVDSTGAIMTVEGFGVEIDWENQKAILASLRDVTEKKHVEQQRRYFLSLISHRLKSPVVGIMEAIDNMLEGLAGELTEKQREYLILMRESITAKYNLINDLLLALRLETGGETCQTESVVLAESVQQAIQLFEPPIQQKDLKINLGIEDQHIHVMADPERFKKVVVQVLHNAVKFTEKGNVNIHVSQTGRKAMIKIKDTGRGMSDATLKTLFEMEKILPGLHDANTGLGFGLYIAKKLMLLQNGDIQAESKLGEGTMITITIPIAE